MNWSNIRGCTTHKQSHTALVKIQRAIAGNNIMPQLLRIRNVDQPKRVAPKKHFVSLFARRTTGLDQDQLQIASFGYVPPQNACLLNIRPAIKALADKIPDINAFFGQFSCSGFILAVKENRQDAPLKSKKKDHIRKNLPHRQGPNRSPQGKKGALSIRTKIFRFWRSSHFQIS